jgi:hypothetical protein
MSELSVLGPTPGGPAQARRPIGQRTCRRQKTPALPLACDTETSANTKKDPWTDPQLSKQAQGTLKTRPESFRL